MREVVIKTDDTTKRQLSKQWALGLREILNRAPFLLPAKFVRPTYNIETFAEMR